MRKSLLSPTHLAFLESTVAKNRARYGGWTMEGPDDEAAQAAAEAAAAKEAADKAAAEKAAAEEAAKKFEPITSQDDFEKRLGARLIREREKYADYDELKAKAEAHDKAKEEAKTEAEKAVDAARKEGSTSERERTDKLLVRAKAETLAAQARFKAPDAVIASLDLSGIKVDENGVVDTAALQTKIDAAIESGAFVQEADGKGKPKPDYSQGGNKGDGSKSVAQVMEDRRAAREAKTKS